jgi:hypothetical protein
MPPGNLQGPASRPANTTGMFRLDAAGWGAPREISDARD